MNPIVISDAGPLIGLARIRRLGLPDGLFAKVLIPPEVEAECCHNQSLPGASQIRQCIESSLIAVVPADEPPDLPSPAALDRGEVAAIALALRSGHRLWIDDLRGRAFARALSVQIVGTGGVLLEARRRGLVKTIGPILEELRRNGYRLSSALIAELLRRAGE